MSALIALHLGAWGLPLRSALANAAAAGAGAVELPAEKDLAPDELSQTGRRQLRQLVESQRLGIAALTFAGRRGFDTLERLEGRIALAKKTLLLAADLGAGMVVANPGAMPAADDAKQKHFGEALDELGREAYRLGVRFALHLPPEGPAALAAFLDGAGNPGLGVHYDPALAYVHRHDPVAGLGMLGTHLAGIAVKDIVRAGAGLSGCTEVPLGEGVLDYQALAAAAAGVEFRGPWTIVPPAPAAEMPTRIAWLARTLR